MAAGMLVWNARALSAVGARLMAVEDTWSKVRTDIVRMDFPDSKSIEIFIKAQKPCKLRK